MTFQELLEEYRAERRRFLVLMPIILLFMALLLSLPAISHAADYAGGYVCSDGALPSFQGDRLAYGPLVTGQPLGLCPDGRTPQVARQTTPLTWRMFGDLVHFSYPDTPYPEATNQIQGGPDWFFDVTGTRCNGAWSMIADPASCLDGVMNVSYFDDAYRAAFTFVTIWPSRQVFNGLQCAKAPLKTWARFPVAVLNAPEGHWLYRDAWLPNVFTEDTCAPDGLGKTTPLGMWRGRVLRPMTVLGKTQDAMIDLAASETYWFPRTQPLALEKLYQYRRFGFARYEMWCDDSLPAEACGAPVVRTWCPVLYDESGRDIDTPSLPTNTAGQWRLVICADFADVEPSDMPAGWTAATFLKGVRGFPGPRP